MLNKRYRTISNDLEKLIESLEANPYIGADLGNNIRKIRMAISDKGRGKSHGARVITYTVEVDEESGMVTLLTIYDKKDRATITEKEIKELLDIL
ncbi:type II toxin-antitoxin system RelE/ParE family toxin [Xylanibacter caecicola]|uniref:type II toxin-antitoxin system RelE/ParE family toxin n=1 Tax=Xylanibacter caecicola TaxID=2736294 RepID=UPI0025859BCD|nr:type II toxin-antitoxin system RelE/ParE family toxin [Xylanibacter caecicola]